MVDDDRDIDIETDGDEMDMDGGVRRVGVSKRYHHNELERKRRDHIKDSFSLLRDVIPSVAGEKISRALILNKASDFIKEMKIKNQQHEEEIETLRQSNFILEEQVKLLQKSRSSGSTESAEKILQSLSGQISEKMKNYTASRPTWEEKNAQIASRLQNSILTQNLSVKSAQNFMDKFVHKQGTKNGPSPSSLIEPSSYYAAPISSDALEPAVDSDNTVVVTSSTNDDPTEVVQSPSGATTKPPAIMTKVVGKVLASPIPSSVSNTATASATKIPRGVVTATPVTTQNTSVAGVSPTAQQQQQQAPAQQQQQSAINPTAISLANALKALAAAQSRAQQQQVQKRSGNISAATTTAVSEKPAASSSAVNKAIPVSVTTTLPVNNADKMASVSVSGTRNVPEILKSEESTTPQAPAAFVQTSVTPTHHHQQPTSSNSSVQEQADSTLNEAAKPQVSLNAILGTNLSPEAERLLSALITSLQPSQVSSSSSSGNGQQPVSVPVTTTAIAAQTLPTTSVISSSALSFCNTMSSELSQGTPQYAPFPSSGTRTVTEQLVGNTADDHFISHEDDTSQLLHTAALVDDGPLSASTDLGALCDLGGFPSSSDDNKRPLELSDSLFTGSSIKRPHMDTEF